MMAIAGPVALALGLLGVLPSFATYLGIVIVILLALFLAGSTQKPRLAKRILGSLAWHGDEKVLDVGCGRGLWLIAAAKHLTTGRAVGVDVWSKRLQSGNSPERTLENARLEGVADRVEVRDGDARSLPFGDETFDVVVTSLVMHHIPRREREKALGEMTRVLKRGGQVVMHDFIPEVAQYSKFFRRSGMTEVGLSWDRDTSFLGFQTLRARKP